MDPALISAPAPASPPDAGMPSMGPAAPTQEPAMPGAIPGAPMDGNAPVSDAQYQELVDLLAKVKAGSSQLSSLRFVSDNKDIQNRRDALKEVFMMMTQAGVDVSDPASVAAFLDKLKQTDPDMYAMFEQALGYLLDESGSSTAAPQLNDMSNGPATPTEPPIQGAA